MISHKHKCIFIHIPKTGGKSIERVFLNSLNLTDQQRYKLLLRPNLNPKLGPPRLSHLFACEYVEIGYVNPNQFQSYFTFAFVRNPWDRLVSEYRWMYAWKYDFKTFLYERFPSIEDDLYGKGDDHYRHVLPQYYYIYDKNGNKLVDFVGRFENLQHDFQYVSQKLKLPVLTLPHENETKQEVVVSQRKLQKNVNEKTQYKINHVKLSIGKKHYSEYYDDYSQKYVGQLYAKDCEVFGYQFQRK